VSIYRYERRVWLALNGKDGIKSSEKILSANKKRLMEYAKYLEASRKSLPRQDKLLRTVKIFASLLGPIPFKKATKKDVVDVLAKYGEGLRRTVPGGGSLHTTSDFQKIVKQFYAWVYDVEDPRHEGYPKAVSWIRVKEPKSTLKASDLLEPNEVKKLIAVTPDLRLKALIAVCYDCGLRVGEALQMHIGDVELQEQCAMLTVSGKTGPRVAYSIESLPLLMQWLDQHPNRSNSEAWLWTDDTEPLSYDRARFKLLECRRKANIRKRVFFHLFRHSSATQNAQLGEPMLRSIYGWSKNSDEPSTYIHLSGETVRKALLEKAGLKQKAQQEPALIMCPRCGNPNQPGASLCVKCKGVLKIQDAISINGIVAEIDTLKSMLGVAMGLQTGYPAKRMTFEEIKQLADGNKAFVELAKKHGLTTRINGNK
jgi:site-specific recombinase XerD